MISADSTPTGLSDTEVQGRQKSGLDNNVKLPNSRSYLDIIRETIFTFVNGVFFSIFLLLISLGLYSDGIIVIAVLFNALLIGVCQEIWAKRKLDRIALLTRPQSLVMRNGKECTLDPREIVRDDILHLIPGEQIVVDGELLQGRVEVDESLLTGESDAIAKTRGDRILSGTFCISGEGYYQAQQVGKDTNAYRLASGARAFRQIYTPVQQQVNRVIRTFILVAAFLWFLVSISVLSRTQSVQDAVQEAAVIAGLVPAGLYLSVTLAYTLGAVRMLRQNILIQQANAVESLSHVKVLCLDKTGTLTTNEIEVNQLYPIETSIDKLHYLLGIYSASSSSRNATSKAIANTSPQNPRSPVEEVLFTSGRKWSGLVFSDSGEDGMAGTYVLGAPEILDRSIPLSAEVWSEIESKTAQGFRVILFAGTSEVASFYDKGDNPQIPPSLQPLGLVILGDRLREGVLETLEGFQQAGVALKIISGDRAQTVAAIARQVGLEGDLPAISGMELAKLDEAQRPDAIAHYQIFGGIVPEQKAEIAQTLRRQGLYVAAIGDGVNDVLFLKQANLGIAMESGSKATKAVADLVLLRDSFKSLPFALVEGQRIQNGIQDVLKLFIVRIFSFTLLILATGQVIGTFPLLTKHSALATVLSVGLPTLCLPPWSRPGALEDRERGRSLMHFVLPAALSLTVAGAIVYLGYLVTGVWQAVEETGIVILDDRLLAVPRSALVTILVMGGLLLMVFLKPPTAFWVAAEPLSGDWRYTGVSLAVAAVYVGILAIPSVRSFFDLTLLGWNDYLFISAIAWLWAILLRLAWRHKWLEQFLGN
ncbi:HAD-IC family P-type ATPase [Roseofilum casamattae]|uniref:HAD-IC family P-type ATPase n=1 Tax=Roseofilum casamattae BLCC-M143 TaxID=3022442 RepID=A0ABT7C1G7_9CYAN|nr:HAD-IC family P-type ATPase [Roseofilum casamattae]MDJ1185275.1 HAD-IC family P-type ATPase [Roseofilum casamattae BLCC-M143]